MTAGLGQTNLMVSITDSEFFASKKKLPIFQPANSSNEVISKFFYSYNINYNSFDNFGFSLIKILDV